MSYRDLRNKLKDIVNEGVFAEGEKEKITAPYGTDERKAQVYGITPEEVKEIEEAFRQYSLVKNSQSYKDWSILYEGIHHEGTYDAGLRNWLACYRWIKLNS